ncbi:(Fe-S)-binding protein [Marimonas lutisalis]|uniref:(Fe-S)-binding protein n=1 Tax=Marimonas lutisalis TaxID=2545756 RepID=UPI0010F91196|nr:(Fe-S)-binding protein [Marimonas lutisalis]
MSETSKAQTAIDTLVNQIDRDIASYLEACVHCGECAEACHFYEATHDPKYTPTYKLFPLVKAYKKHKAPLRWITQIFGAPDEITEEELRDWEELVYDSCTMCGRCTLVCPMGIDIAGTIRKVREGYAAADIVPEGLAQARANVERTSSPMGVTARALLKQVEHQEEDTGLKIPVDVEGADYLALLSSHEIMASPEIIGAYAKIFDRAGVSWTLSTEAYEATNVGVQIGSGPLARQLVQRVVDEAERLGVKYVISPECGHAYGAIRWAGPNLIGRSFKFEVLHILELLDKLRAEGRIPPGERDTRKMTLHDPCQIVRRGGLLKEPRRLLDDACSNFVEMKGAGVTNYCCGGGGGVSANQRAEDLMIGAFGKKLEQIDDLGNIDAVVVPCANCRGVFEDGLFELDRDEIEVVSLGQLVADTLADDPKTAK